jgi:trimethyllysine dioxygenase
LLVDGFYTASRLSPAAYTTLRRLKVPTHASGNDNHLLRPTSHTTLRHDEHGNLAQVRWNNEDRGILGPGWTPQDITDWYAAAREFESINRSPEAEYWTKLKPGTVVGECNRPRGVDRSDRQLASHAWSRSVYRIAADVWRVHWSG